MAVGGYQVRPDQLCTDAERLTGISEAVLASVTEPLTPPTAANEGFASTPALVIAGESWEAETRELAEALRAAGTKLRDTAAEYNRADTSCAVTFRRILRSC